MNNLIWIIDPDQSSAQAMRSALDTLGPQIETMPAFENREPHPAAVLLAGAIGIEAIEANIAALRRMGGDDLLPITIIGGVQGNAEALALGADHFLPSPVMLGELVDHLLRFMPMEDPEDFERSLPQSRGLPKSGEMPEPEQPVEPAGTESEDSIVKVIAGGRSEEEEAEALVEAQQIAEMMAGGFGDEPTTDAVLDPDQIAAMMAEVGDDLMGGDSAPMDAVPSEDAILDPDQVAALLAGLDDEGASDEAVEADDDAILDPDQIAAMMEGGDDDAILDPDQIAAMMEGNDKESLEPDQSSATEDGDDDAILDPDQIAAMMEGDDDDAILDPDQIAAMMEGSDEASLEPDQSPAMEDGDDILDPDQIAAMMEGGDDGAPREPDQSALMMDEGDETSPGDDVDGTVVEDPMEAEPPRAAEGTVEDNAVLDTDQIAAMMGTDSPAPEAAAEAEPQSDPETPEEPLFGLKQPQEVVNLSGNESNEPFKWVEDRPQTGTDLSADASWGLDGDPDDNDGTPGWGGDEDRSSSEAGWGNDDGGWDAQGGDGDGWGDDGGGGDDDWGTQGGNDEGWGDGGSDDGWGDDGGGDAWGGNDDSGSAQQPNWSQSAPGRSAPTDLSKLGEQLLAQQPKPRAPVGRLGVLPPTGLLGLLARCGADRVTGRVDLNQGSLRLSIQMRDGRVSSINSAALDELVLRAAYAQGWLDNRELAAVRHLQQRRHSSAAAVMSREGLRSGDELQRLSQDCAERLLLRAAQNSGGEASYRPELGEGNAIGLAALDSETRIIETAKNLVGSPVYVGAIGGDDAAPEPCSGTLPKSLPGREALSDADGETSLFELAAASGTPIAEVRAGCLAAVALGLMELRRLGAAQLQAAQRPDKSFHRIVAQIRSGDYFAVLGLADAHSSAEVQRAYASRVAILRQTLAVDHPQFVELAEELAEAKEVLLDPDLRAQYRTAKPSVEA